MVEIEKEVDFAPRPADSVVTYVKKADGQIREKEAANDERNFGEKLHRSERLVSMSGPDSDFKRTWASNQTISTFIRLVLPGTSNGTPAVTTTRSPALASFRSSTAL